MDGSQQVWSEQHKNQPVWISNNEDAWIPGIITEVQSGKHIQIRYVEDPSIQSTSGTSATKAEIPVDSAGQCLKTTRIVPRDVGPKGSGLDNMDDLTHLNEACVLHNVSVRFADKKIYTRTGPILVAMNPFEWLPIYDQNIMIKYSEAGRDVDSLDPHCFAEAQKAYTALISSSSSQSLIICGESGAGKTETTKLMLEFLSHNYTDSTNRGIADRIMKSNPLLEAFGNAKTLRNRNSSRFGKFIQLRFQAKTIAGAHISNYLLEKSRAVRQNIGERNYHIFYQLCRGAEPKQAEELGLNQNLESFRYLNQSGCLEVLHLNDASEYHATIDAMQAVDISKDDIESIMKIVAAILHLGNVTFGKTPLSPRGKQPQQKGFGAKSSTPSSRSSSGLGEFEEETKGADANVAAQDVALHKACELLGCSPVELAQALTVKYINVNGKAIESPLDNRKASDLRDALSKSIYSLLFTYIVECVNASLDQGHLAEESAQPFIGILDIYGFESFEENGFEQLLINFANEKLQSLFNEQVFRAEEAMYKAENVPFSRMEIPNNEKCISLMHGIFKLMHDECLRMGAGSDRSLAGQITQQNRAHVNFGVCGPGSKHKGTTELNFAIQHYAGEIVYTCTDFIKKNRDTLYVHVESLLARSQVPLVAKLFDSSHSLPTHESKAPGVASNKLQETVAKHFAAQVQVLTETIQQTNPIFVRCIKTNNELVKSKVDRNSVLRQLRNAGVIAALEMRRAGFPNRLAYKEFCLRCRVLLPRDAHVGDAYWKSLAEELFASSPIAVWRDQVALGKTKVFLRANILHEVDSVILQHVTEQVVTVQSIVRQFLHVRRFRIKRRLVLWSQSHWRGVRVRREYQKQIHELESKRKWFLRSARLSTVSKAYQQARTRRNVLTKWEHALNMDILDSHITSIETLIQDASEFVNARENLDLADASLVKCENALSEVAPRLASSETAFHKLEARLEELLNEKQELDSLLQEFLTEEAASKADLCFEPVASCTKAADVLATRLISKYGSLRLQTIQVLESAVDHIDKLAVDAAENDCTMFRTRLDELKRALRDALNKKRDIEANYKRIYQEADLIKTLLKRTLLDFHGTKDLHRLEDIHDSISTARETFSHLTEVMGKPSMFQELPWQGTTSSSFMMSKGNFSHMHRRKVVNSNVNEYTDDDCSSDEDNDLQDNLFLFPEDGTLQDVEDIDIALVHAKAAVESLEEDIIESKKVIVVLNKLTEELRDQCKESVISERDAQVREMEALRPFDFDLLMDNVRVRKYSEHMKDLRARAAKFTCRNSTTSTTKATLEAANEEIAEVTKLIERATKKFEKEVHRIRSRLDEVRSAQNSSREMLLPALDRLKQTRNFIARHQLENRFKLHDALQSVELQVEEANSLLDEHQGLLTDSDLSSIPYMTETAIDLIEAFVMLADDEFNKISALRKEVLQAQSTAEHVSREIGRLQAQMMRNPVFETRSVRGLCKASWCSAQVCKLANQFCNELTQTQTSLDRLTSKVGALHNLQQHNDKDDQEESISCSIHSAAQRAATCCASAEATLTALIQARSKEVEKLAEHKDCVESMRLRLERVKHLSKMLRKDNLHMPLEHQLRDAACTILDYNEGVEYLTASEFEARDLDDEYRAAESSSRDSQEPIRVLLFVKADPMQVIEEAHGRAMYALQQVEQVVSTQQAFVIEASRLDQERELREVAKSEATLKHRSLQRAKVSAVRKDSIPKLEPARRLLATLLELDAQGLCDNLSSSTRAQIAHLAYCVNVFEDSVLHENPDLAQEQVTQAMAEYQHLHELLFSAEKSCAGLEETKEVDNDNFEKDCYLRNCSSRKPDLQWENVRAKMSHSFHAEAAAKTRDSIGHILGGARGQGVLDLQARYELEFARWRALRAEVSLRMSQTQDSKVLSPLHPAWRRGLEAAQAALECAEKKVNNILHLSETSVIVLHLIDRGDLDTRVARDAQEAWSACESALRFARDQVNSAESGFHQTQRVAERHDKVKVHAKRLVLKYVCPRREDDNSSVFDQY